MRNYQLDHNEPQTDGAVFHFVKALDSPAAYNPNIPLNAQPKWVEAAPALDEFITRFGGVINANGNPGTGFEPETSAISGQWVWLVVGPMWIWRIPLLPIRP